jgi:hypothetical protein
MSLALIFLIVALVLFLLSAFNVPSSRVGLQSLGLAFVVIAQLVGARTVL